MRTKTLVSSGLIAALLGGWAMAADPVPKLSNTPTRMDPNDSPTPAITGQLQSLVPDSQPQRPMPQPDDWISGARCGCCGPVGRDGPIGQEFYTRQGIAIPVAGSGFIRNSIEPGFITQYGARTLFFNAMGDAAWTADLSLSYTYNNGHRPELQIDLPGSVGPALVNVRSLQRTSFNVAGGREWFVYSPGFGPESNARIGIDVGGRWGYARAELNDVFDPTIDPIPFLRRSDVFGATFVGLHSDVEIPLNQCWKFVAGFRVEWNYHFSDLIPGEKNQFQEVNLLLNFGLRY